MSRTIERSVSPPVGDPKLIRARDPKMQAFLERFDLLVEEPEEPLERMAGIMTVSESMGIPRWGVIDVYDGTAGIRGSVAYIKGEAARHNSKFRLAKAHMAVLGLIALVYSENPLLSVAKATERVKEGLGEEHPLIKLFVPKEEKPKREGPHRKKMIPLTLQEMRTWKETGTIPPRGEPFLLRVAQSMADLTGKGPHSMSDALAFYVAYAESSPGASPANFVRVLRYEIAKKERENRA